LNITQKTTKNRLIRATIEKKPKSQCLREAREVFQRKCELAQGKIALFAYGELPDNEYPSLERHLTICERCQEEFAAVFAMQQAIAHAPAPEPSVHMLEQARLRLDEELNSMARSSWLDRTQQVILRSASIVGSAPGTASALLILCLATGGWVGYQTAISRHRPSVEQVHMGIEGPGRIVDVSSIIREPNTSNIEIHFDRLVPMTVRGSLRVPQMQQLLLLGAQDRVNSKVEEDSVRLLADESLAGHPYADGLIRKALLVALRYGKNTEARLNALNGLRPYVAEDTQVRDGVLEALMNDPTSTVRSRAIDLLQPVEADSSVREVFHTVASEDDDVQIRTVSREVLRQLPPIE
jgi:hypothetical protein